ncbi:Glycoside hydrolase, 38 vacuolar alpha mannosidase [Ascosphaera pollenicola]|nr:Glycoside hydrolase, 38 vacuolar alpha mannosidase [Ascosphaera pollenicola]
MTLTRETGRATIIKNTKDLKLRPTLEVVKLMLSYNESCVEFLFQIIKAALNHGDYKFWMKLMTRPDGSLRWTYEVNSHSKFRCISTSDPENVKAILATQFSDYGRGAHFHDAFETLFGEGIFSVDGQAWYNARKLMRPLFSKDRLVDTTVFEKHVERLLPLLDGSRSSPFENKAVHIQPLLYAYTLDASVDYLVGHDLASIVTQNAFKEAFDYIKHRLGMFMRAQHFAKFMSHKRYDEELRVINDFARPFIQQTLSTVKVGDGKTLSDGETFIHSLARFTRDPKEIRDQLVSILIAGRDTTAVTMNFCLFELSRNPEAFRRLKEEITKTLGKRAPTYRDLKDMRYLNWVVHETLRLYPIIPFNVRTALKDTSLPRGGGPDGDEPIGVLAGTRIFYSVMDIQRRVDLYPTPEEATDKKMPYYDPLHFAPERWEHWHPKPWAFLPFSGGPRICIGQQFALTKVSYTIARIVQHFSQIKPINAPPPGVDPEFVFDITLGTQKPLECLFIAEEEKEEEQLVNIN